MSALKNVHDFRELMRFGLQLPQLHPSEHEWIESRVGRKLSNEEAQIALRNAKLEASLNRDGSLDADSEEILTTDQALNEARNDR